MTYLPTTNVWHRYNLTDSPFFQESLAFLDTKQYPADLFVGRAAEIERLLKVIGGHRASRQVVEGPPGIGKTTLVQYIKARTQSHGYLSDIGAVNLGRSGDADSLAVGILDYVCRTLIANSVPEQDPALEEARRLVHVVRLQDYSAGLTVAGFGAQGGRATQSLAPAFLYPHIVVGDLLNRLMRLATDSLGISGIIIHLNNLENITENNAERAGLILRDLRDTCLFAERYHWIVTGTSDAIGSAIGRLEQLRSVFSVTGPLEPLSTNALHDLLARRYAHLRLDPQSNVTPPIAPDAVTHIYQLFQGDLRGTLRALDESATALLGFGEAGSVAPLGANEVLRALASVYRSEMHARLSARAIDGLTRSAAHGLDRIVTQSVLAHEWGLSRSMVYLVISDLQANGYLVYRGAQLERKPGRPESQYAFTGTTKLTFSAT